MKARSEDWDATFDDMDAEDWENHYASHEPIGWDDMPDDDDRPPEDISSDAFDPTDF